MLVVLCNAATTFDRMIDTVLDDLKWKTGVCYLDDVIFLFTFMEDLQRSDDVLTCLSEASLQIDTRKEMPFRQTSIKVLGHDVRKEGIRADLDKINGVLYYSRPPIRKELHSFVGFACYFQGFIRNFATIASQNNELLTSGTPFLWTDNCEISFKAPKEALTSGFVLCHFDESTVMILNTDDSGHDLLSFSNVPMPPQNMLSPKRAALCPLPKRTLP